MRVVESTRHKIFLDSHAQSRFARRCHRVLRLHRGHVEEVAPDRSGVRVSVEQKVSPTLDIFRHSPDQWKDRFYSLQVAVSIVAEKRQSGAEYHELEFL
jgi:ABC-type sulfate/molybdate transport systems ATPase subunit